MNRVPLIEKELTGSIIEAFFEVYNELGHGYLEQIYMTVMERALLARGHRVLREVSVRVSFRGQFVGLQRLDMLVDDKVLVEAKSTAELPKVAQRQIVSYLRATSIEVGLLLHFGSSPRFYRFVSTNRQP
jgi:GxxExxY protein